MLGVSLFSIIYGLIRSALLLGVLSLFFSVDLSDANLLGATIILLAGSISFLGFGIMAAVFPLLFPERGEELTFVISSILLLVSGVYYPVSVLPDWMQPLATISPATYVLEGMRASLLEGKPTQELGPYLVPILLLGALAIPLGIAIFNWGERYAKRTGRLEAERIGQLQQAGRVSSHHPPLLPETPPWTRQLRRRVTPPQPPP
ncbi:MAG: ABC transporter permease [Thermomicrobiales bacterium]